MPTLREKAFKRPRRQGAIVVLAAIFLVIVVAFLAFSADFGYIVVTDSELQNAADAGAMSGARALSDGREAAIAAAKTWSGKNIAAGEAVVVADADVEIGLWNFDTATFTPLPEDSSDSPNAVRVTCRRSAASGNPLNLFLAPILGTDSVNLTVTAIASPVLSCGGFVGIEAAAVNSGFTDSFNSSQGSYASQVPGDEGDVCSNKDILVQAPVNGNASPGIGYGVSIQGSGAVTGSTNPHTTQSYEPADAGNAASWNDNNLIAPEFWMGDKLLLSSSDFVEFPGGTLYTNTLTVNGELRITGPTTIYVMEKVDVAGQGLVNASQTPSDLKIILLDQLGRSSTFSGSSNTYATIYGPGADVTVSGNAAFFGAVIAEQLKLSNNGGCHYDEDLHSDIDLANKVKLVQ